jgi:hypothetical protein
MPPNDETDASKFSFAAAGGGIFFAHPYLWDSLFKIKKLPLWLPTEEILCAAAHLPQ